MPYSDYLEESSDSPTGAEWTEPWDDMTTAYGSQYPVLIGTCGITYELPAYNDITAQRMVVYGMLNQASYVKSHKAKLMETQAELFERGIKNTNSNEKVKEWYVDQYDRSSIEQAELMRPVYDGEGETGNFYPECYIIPMDQKNQVNRLEAAEEVKYLTRNDCKVYITKSAFTFDGVKYPAGTVVVPLYQAKRSLVNSQLSDGTFISVWKGLYSESLAQRSRARGYDRIVCAKTGDYKKIMKTVGSSLTYSSALTWESKLKSSLSGSTGADVIVKNSSEDSSAAVVELLKKECQVGMITAGKYQGDFIMSYGDYKKVAGKYVLNAKRTDGAGIQASVIKGSPKVYVVGKAADNGAGYVQTTTVSGRYNYNFDMYAMKAMGLDVTASATKADVIIGSTNALSETALECIREGTPYLGHGTNGVKAVSSLLSVKTSSCDYGTDMLGIVEYPEKTMTNSTYVNEKDDVMYEYGTYWFPEVPEGARVIVKNADKTPLQGCIGLFNDTLKSQFNDYNKGAVGLEYQKDDLDLVLFSNVLSHKAHQQDEFTYMSNFAFSRCLKSGDSGKYKPATTAVKKVTGLKTKSSSKKVTLSWKKSPGATKYKVYRAVKKNGTYKLVKTTTKTKVTLKNVKKGRKSYYKVRAVKIVSGASIYSAYSKVVKG